MTPALAQALGPSGQCWPGDLQVLVRLTTAARGEPERGRLCGVDQVVRWYCIITCGKTTPVCLQCLERWGWCILWPSSAYPHATTRGKLYPGWVWRVWGAKQEFWPNSEGAPRLSGFRAGFFRNVSLSAGGRMDFSIYLWKFETIGNWTIFWIKSFSPQLCVLCHSCWKNRMKWIPVFNVLFI